MAALSTAKAGKMRYAKVSALLFTIVFMAYYFYGIRAVYVAGVSVISSFLSDYLCVSAMKKKFDWSDESPLMSGLLLALLMPASIPYTIMAFSAAFMTIVGKHAFGGNDNLIFCPVSVAYIFTCLCFPSAVLRYPTPVPFGSISTANVVTDSLTYSYTHFLDNNAASTFSLLDLIWGKLAGPMGASAVVIILICGVALYFFRDIPSMALFAGFGANVIINVVFPVGEKGWYAVLNSLVAGSYLFVLVFMACDVRYVPKKQFSQLLYGVLFAAGAFLMRRYTVIESSAVFMLPILCVFRDEFDRLTAALHRLLAFLWKWTKILSNRAARLTAAGLHRLGKFTWKWTKILSVKASKLTVAGLRWLGKFIWKWTKILSVKAVKAFDAICEAVSNKIVEASKRRKQMAANNASAADENGSDHDDGDSKCTDSTPPEGLTDSADADSGCVQSVNGEDTDLGGKKSSPETDENGKESEDA